MTAWVKVGLLDGQGTPVVEDWDNVVPGVYELVPEPVEVRHVQTDLAIKTVTLGISDPDYEAPAEVLLVGQSPVPADHPGGPDDFDQIVYLPNSEACLLFDHIGKQVTVEYYVAERGGLRARIVPPSEGST